MSTSVQHAKTLILRQFHGSQLKHELWTVVSWCCCLVAAASLLIHRSMDSASTFPLTAGCLIAFVMTAVTVTLDSIGGPLILGSQRTQYGRLNRFGRAFTILLPSGLVALAFAGTHSISDVFLFVQFAAGNALLANVREPVTTFNIPATTPRITVSLLDSLPVAADPMAPSLTERNSAEFLEMDSGSSQATTSPAQATLDPLSADQSHVSHAEDSLRTALHAESTVPELSPVADLKHSENLRHSDRLEYRELDHQPTTIETEFAGLPSRTRNTAIEELTPPAGSIDDDVDTNTVQTFRRVRFANEDELIEGLVRVEFASGERRKIVHLPFVPHLAHIPELHCDIPANEARARATDRKRYGARIEVTRATATISQDVTLRFTVRSQP